MIHSLDEDVRSLIRSGIAVSNLTQCLDEFVLNSLDAGATCVSVRVDIPSFRLQVIDNGSGISKDDLELLGERYATSKCHSLEDLSELKSYGFRGEALASIRDIAGILEVVTRHKSSSKTYCKIFRNGKALKVSESCLPRSNIGTTVTAYDLFASLPVRRKLVSDVFDLEKMRQRLASIALINPNASFSLYNEASGQKSFQTHKSQSTVSTFSQLFGNLKAKSLREICFEETSFRMSGYVGLETHHHKNLQFVYINSRLLLKTKIHKLINRLLTRSLLFKKTLPFDERGNLPGQLRSSPKQVSEKYPIFILNIHCPLTDYDITLEPAKTLVEFQDWDGLLSCVQGCIESFLTRENLLLPGEQTEDVVDDENSASSQAEDSSDRQVDLSVYEYQTIARDGNRPTQSISPSNIRKSLQSSVVHRKPTQLRSAEDRNGDTAHKKEDGRDRRLTDVEEIRLKSSNNSLRNDKVSTNIRSEIVIKATKDFEKRIEQKQDRSLDSGIEKSTLGVTKKRKNSLYGRAQVFLQESSPSDTSTRSKRCFTSPNPITLQTRGVRKRFHDDVHSKVINSNSCTSLNRFALDRTNRCSRISSIENARIQGDPSNNSNLLATRNSTRIIEGTHGSSLQETTKTKRKIAGEDRELDGVGLSEEMCEPPESNLLHQGRKEKSLFLDDENCTTDRPSFETTEADDSQTRQPLNYNDDMITQEIHTQSEETSVTSDKDESVKTGNKIEDNIMKEEVIPRELGMVVHGVGHEAGTSEAPKDTSGDEVNIRKDFDDDQREKCSHSLEREDSDCSYENWKCTYDVNLQRKLYINLRTGNTSYDCPEGLHSDADQTKEEERSLEGRKETHMKVPLGCAPHVSFDCTPWLPRKNRMRTTRSRDQMECEMNDSLSSTSQSLFDEKTMTESERGYGGLVSQMFDEWDNPVLGTVPGMDITRLSKPSKGTGNEVRVHKSIHPYRFTKDMVKDLQVIRQLDDKFIVCRVRRPPDDGHCNNIDTQEEAEEEAQRDYLVVLLDQHAVHERIRLEKLIEDLCVSETNHTNQPRLKASTVSPPIELDFTSQELLLLKRFRSELQRVGVRFVIGSGLESGESCVIVHELPGPFVDREVSETRRRRPSVAVSIVKELIQSHVEHMRQTSGVAPTIPKTILRVLTSQACHGAVKFGEHLTIEECKQLIRDLSTCDLPFQCAHGRPSIVPLVDLHLLRTKTLQSEAVGELPKLTKLRNAINIH